MLPIDLLCTLPADKKSIRDRFDHCLAYFAQKQANYLGLPLDDLRDVLPEMVFFDEFGNGSVPSSALGAYNHGEHVLKLNANAILSGHTAIEMIVFHEYTHAMDGLLIGCFTSPDEYRIWLKQYMVDIELAYTNRLYPLIDESIEFIQRPNWNSQQFQVARILMAQLLAKPKDYFKFDTWEKPVVIKAQLYTKIKDYQIAELANVEESARYFKALFVYYLYAATSAISPPLNKTQKKALQRLKAKINPRLKALAMRRLLSIVSLDYGAYTLHYGSKAFGVTGYFELPESIQMGYLCAEGEIRARKEASKLLLGAIKEWEYSNSQASTITHHLHQEVDTLKASIQLESLLLQWQRLQSYPGANSTSSEKLKQKIQKLSVFARTHKLVKHFYPSEEAYLICREWNEKRIWPYPDEIKLKLGILKVPDSFIYDAINELFKMNSDTYT